MKNELITVATMSKKSISTFEREMKNAKFKKAFEQSYKELLLSELLIAIMEEDEKSVRGLAKEVGISPTVIQKIRSGKQDNIKVSNFVSIVHACGYKLFLEKEDERFEVKDRKLKDKHLLNFVTA
jgi:DNA-binding Xre family transcriptional regulator